MRRMRNPFDSSSAPPGSRSDMGYARSRRAEEEDLQ